eukprot:jgi/Phyca11/102729/e_gw1.7.1037.1
MLRTISAEQQKRVNLLLAEWIARHFRPIKIVEDAGFIVFIRYITEDICRIKISLPERTKIAQQIVALAVEYRKLVRQAIAKGCCYFSMTCDIWTSRNTKSYISLTIHYVDNDFCPQNWTLEVKELVAHCLHKVVGGALIKKKRASGVADEPDWAAE